MLIDSLFQMNFTLWDYEKCSHIDENHYYIHILGLNYYYSVDFNVESSSLYGKLTFTKYFTKNIR